VGFDKLSLSLWKAARPTLASIQTAAIRSATATSRTA
jgi:hypothetical protein